MLILPSIKVINWLLSLEALYKDPLSAQIQLELKHLIYKGLHEVRSCVVWIYAIVREQDGSLPLQEPLAHSWL